MIFISTAARTAFGRFRRAARARFAASPFRLPSSPLLPCSCPEQGRNFPCYLRVEHSLYCSGIGFKHMGLRFFSRRNRHEGSAIFPVFLPITGKKQRASGRSGDAPAARTGAGRGLATGRKRRALAACPLSNSPSNFRLGRNGCAVCMRSVSRPGRGMIQVNSAMTAAVQPDRDASQQPQAEGVFSAFSLVTSGNERKSGFGISASFPLKCSQAIFMAL